MEQQTGSKLGKESVKTAYCHFAYLIYIHNTLCEMSGWMNHKLESRLQTEISITSDVQMIDTILMAESKEELRSLLMRVKRGE